MHDESRKSGEFGQSKMRNSRNILPGVAGTLGEGFYVIIEQCLFYILTTAKRRLVKMMPR